MEKVRIIVEQLTTPGRRPTYKVKRVTGALKPRVGWRLNEKEVDALIKAGQEVIVDTPRPQ
jgi:hypothetical protein